MKRPLTSTYLTALNEMEHSTSLQNVLFVTPQNGHYADYVSAAQFITAQVASTLIVFAFSLHLWLKKPTTRHTLADAAATTPPPISGSAGPYIVRVGGPGPKILIYKSSRLCSLFALLCFSGVTSYKFGWNRLSLISTEATIIAVAMAVADLALPAQTSRVGSPYLTIITLAIFAFYAYRDIWPLMTYTLRPIDEMEGSLLWVKVTLSTWAGLLEPLLEPYPFIPVHPEDPTAVANPEQTASILRWIFWSFLDPVVWRAYRLPHLSHDQLPPLADYDEAHYLTEKHYEVLDPLTGAKDGSMVWAIIKVVRVPLLVQGICVVLTTLLGVASPVGVNRLLNYLEHPGEGAFVRPWVWVLFIALGPLANTMFKELYLFSSTRSLIRVEGLLTALIFDHALRLRVKAELADDTSASGPSRSTISENGGNFVGRIMTMATGDLNNITGGRNFLTLVMGVPLKLAVYLWFLYAILGWSAGRMSGVQKEKMKATDGRVQVVAEIMGVLRMIKLFGWEKRAQNDVAVKREEELKWIWRRALYGLINFNVNYIIPLLHMIVTYAIYTLIMKQNLTASIVFSTLSVFGSIRGQLNQISMLMPAVIAAYVSLGRLGEYLRKTEMLDMFDGKPATDVRTCPTAHRQDIGFGKAEFSWTALSGSPDANEQVFRLRIADDLVFQKGILNLIYGPTACGKTSMLMALLGEMHYTPLDIDSWVNLPRDGGVAYASQESWVLSETIKDNILFGAPLDEERYRKVIHQCALTEDLLMFNSGDNTQIGERGITLSGGQKARITLARAVYSSAEIVLLDDILAALDVHTAQWITSRCLNGDLLKGRTVILVTHRVTFVSPLAKYVVSMTHGGIETHGSAYEVLKMTPEAAEEMLNSQLETLDQTKATKSTPGSPGVKEEKLVIAEEVALGHVSRNAYKLLLGNMASKGVLAVGFWTQYLGAVGLGEVCNVLELWWLGYWTSKYTLQDPADVRATFYLGIYALIIVASIAVRVYETVVYTFGSIRAARVIHSELISSVVGSTFRWLDVTPTSRVITRCTQDIQAVDGPVSQAFQVVVTMILGMITKLGVVVLYTPVFLPPALVIVSFGIWLGSLYIKTQLSVKREMSNAKAPVLATFGGAIHGLVSIRAYGAQTAFREELFKRINDYTRAGRIFWCLNRWIAVRLYALSAIFAGAIALYFVYGDAAATPSSVGFVLTVAISFTEGVLNFVHWYNNLEVNANSLERLYRYITIEQEPKDGNKPPAYWPSSGNLHVKKLSASYTPDGPKVIQGLSFDVKSGERIGVVGRTGAGKSTLTLALLRCIPTEGLVTYDGIPTNSITLDNLRSNITIIPQMPELLSGTMRHNLDPFGQYDDATLNDALRSAGLFSLQQQVEESGRITLDTKVAGGGANLSGGQRQIVALARAIVRQSKLLILDEATSAIDYETDAVIQQSLRRELKSDVSVITVAHRLQTIMDYDKIMVLDAGHLVEFDTPRALLEKRYGLFRAMVEQSADKDALLAAALGS
ncbi:hypothetical protein PHLGIDRAFT_413728 [Phlebiopsis gigantea 11061_1 CR5-6]|uniref:P-loop containing nucleoside triphosphate hydrolase protein n=1 Tax=Phlebiopsis gigantea (strain 11061_1 CR5-6) TaxID=745531 RepID=A0A0C3SB45_PHLG1|nr:hypothetical protein PHLGIDRAFT_413728 [Phlebiopsis gigantea 11061_1 CR5-6]